MIGLFAKVPVLLLLVLSATSVVVGDYFGKKWSIEQRSMWYAIAFLGYAGSSLFYLPTLLREGLVTTSIVWSLLSIIGFLFIGLVVFHEKLNGLQTIGVGFGVIALIILSVSFGHNK